MTRYIVWKPGKEEHAKILDCETQFEARRIMAAVSHLQVTDLCAIHQEHIGFVGARVRNKFPAFAEEEESV